MKFLKELVSKDWFVVLLIILGVVAVVLMLVLSN